MRGWGKGRKRRHRLRKRSAALLVATPLILSLSTLNFLSSRAEVGASGVDGETGGDIVVPQTISSGDQDFAMIFDGSSQWAVGSDDAVFDLSGTLTFEAWLKPESASGCFILKRQVYEMCVNSSGYWFGLDDNSSGWNWYPNSGVDARLGEWQHFAFVKSGSTVTFLLDGQEAWTASDAPATLGNSSNPFVLGSQNESGAGLYSGLIDEVRVWNTARSVEEVRADMHTYGPIDATGLVAYYDFNEGPSGTTGTGTVYNRVSGASSATNLRTIGSPTYTDAASRPPIETNSLLAVSTKTFLPL